MKLRVVAVVVPELLPVPAVNGGAVEHWVEEFLRQPKPFVCRWISVSRPSGGAMIADVECREIPWTSWEKRWNRLKNKLSRQNPLRLLAKIQNVWSYGRRVAHAVADADLVYIHNEPNLLFFLANNPTRKLVLHMHNDHLSIRMFRSLYRRQLTKLDAVIFVSEYLRGQAAKLFPEYADIFRVVPNATNGDYFRPYGPEADAALAELLCDLPQPRELVLYVGRLIPEKGVDVLIDAFAQLLVRHPKARLVIAGSSFFEHAIVTDYVATLRQRADPIREAIRFTGFVPHDTVKYLYAAANLVIFPPVWQEPFGLVMIEAMASGACVIASNTGGIPEVMRDGENGILVAPGQSAELSAAMEHQLDDPQGSCQLGYRAREHVLRHHSWPLLTEAVMNILREQE